MAKASIKPHGEGACPHAPQAGRAVAPRPPPLVRLGEVCAQVRGVSYKPRDAREEFAAGYVPLLRANNIGENGLNHDEIVYVKRECVRDFQFVHTGDLLVCASSGSRHLVGKAAQILSDKQETFGAFCKVVRPDPQRILPDYLAQYFQSDVYRRTIANKAAGANINNIRSEHIDDLQIPLPPLPEQKRIAAILDKICEMKRNAEARLQKLDLLVKARFVEMFGDAEAGTAKYPVVRLEDVCSSLSAGKDVPEDHTKEPDATHLIPIFSNGIERSGLYGYASFARITEPSITISGRGTIGWVCRRMTPFVPIIRLIVATPKLDVVDIVYLESALRGRCAVNTGTTIPQLPVPTAKNIKVIFPPLTLQRQFAAFVEKVEGLKATAKKELEQVDLLYRAKLQEFFG